MDVTHTSENPDAINVFRGMTVIQLVWAASPVGGVRQSIVHVSCRVERLLPKHDWKVSLHQEATRVVKQRSVCTLGCAMLNLADGATTVRSINNFAGRLRCFALTISLA